MFSGACKRKWDRLSFYGSSNLGNKITPTLATGGQYSALIRMTWKSLLRNSSAPETTVNKLKLA